jgi:hypothetical protein
MSLITNGLQKRNSSVLNTQTKAEETSMRQRQEQKPDVNTIEKYSYYVNPVFGVSPILVLLLELIFLMMTNIQTVLFAKLVELIRCLSCKINHINSITVPAVE